MDGRMAYANYEERMRRMLKTEIIDLHGTRSGAPFIPLLQLCTPGLGGFGRPLDQASTGGLSYVEEPHDQSGVSFWSFQRW